MLEIIVLGITGFVGTNIDDLFVDTLLFAETENAKERMQVMIGKYIGIGLLVLVSLAGARGFALLPDVYIRLLGLVPIVLGIREMLLSLREREEDKDDKGRELPEGKAGRKSGDFIGKAAAITVANGADNIGVYIPMFAGFAGWQLSIVAVIFGVMTGLWCFVGQKAAGMPILRRLLRKYRCIIVPTVYIALGIYIISNHFL